SSQEIWRRMEANGDIYLDTYAGWYSVRDERVFADDEVHTNDAVVRVATETGTEGTWTEEESYFFRLSAYADKLLAHYKANPDCIAPQTRADDVIRQVDGGLGDLSISSTSFDWGIPVPEPTNPDLATDKNHVMYVWVDALTNYLTGAGFPDDTSELRRYWPADLHVIGKDIS